MIYFDPSPVVFSSVDGTGVAGGTDASGRAAGAGGTVLSSIWGLSPRTDPSGLNCEGGMPYKTLTGKS
jgi:hypothetical protein